MAKKDTFVMFAFIVFTVVLAIVFTIDDATGIGEVLDPLQFAFMTLVGYFGGKKL